VFDERNIELRVFGPAYKGIPCIRARCEFSFSPPKKGRNFLYAYNRKEAKTTEKAESSQYGAPLKGRVVGLLTDSFLPAHQYVSQLSLITNARFAIAVVRLH